MLKAQQLLVSHIDLLNYSLKGILNLFNKILWCLNRNFWTDCYQYYYQYTYWHCIASNNRVISTRINKLIYVLLAMLVGFTSLLSTASIVLGQGGCGGGP